MGVNEKCPKCKVEITNMNDCSKRFYMSDKYYFRMCDDCGINWDNFQYQNLDILFELFIQPERSKREDSKYFIPEDGPIKCDKCNRPPCQLCN